MKSLRQELIRIALSDGQGGGGSKSNSYAAKEHSIEAYRKYKDKQLSDEVRELRRQLDLIKAGEDDNKVNFVADYDVRVHKVNQFPEYLATESKVYAGNIAADGTLTYDPNDQEAVETYEDQWGVIHVRYLKDVVIIFDKLKAYYTHYLYFEKHPQDAVLYAEYDADGNVLAVKYSQYDTDTEGKDGVIRFNEKTKRVAFYIPKIEQDYTWRGAVVLQALMTTDTPWEPDYYAYSEVLSDGYTPNPDKGVRDFYYTDKELSQSMVYNPKDFRRGVLYNRWSWSDLYDEENKKYDFSKPAEMYKLAIEEGSRVHDGLFMTAFESNGNKYETSSRVIYYSFPKFVFDLAYQADAYFLSLVKQDTTENGKPVYTAAIDWRNADVFNAYKDALQQYRNFLETTEHDGHKFIDALSCVEIRFFGLWGEGHWAKLIEQFGDDLEDSDTMLDVVGLYEDIFSDKYLIAPCGGFSTLYEETSYKDWQKYYLENDKFGFFDDHIGQKSMFYTDFDFDGIDTLQVMMDRHKTAPVTGEVYNYGEYNWQLPLLVFTENDTRGLHLSSFRYTNNKGKPYTYDFNYSSYKDMLKNCYDIAGDKLFYIPVASYIKNDVYKCTFLLGNLGVAPTYGTYWMPRITIRNQQGEVIDTMSRILGADFDLRAIPMMSEPCVPSYQECMVVDVSRKIKYNTDYTGCDAFLSFEDTTGISVPMYLANTGRTSNGEYPLGLPLSSDVYEPEDESKYKYLFDVTFDSEGYHIAAGDVSVTTHGDGEYVEDGWKNTTSQSGIKIDGISTLDILSAENVQLCVEYSDVYLKPQFRTAFMSADEDIYTPLYSNSGYTFVKDTDDFWNGWGYRTLDGMDTAPRGDLKHVAYYDNIKDVRTITTTIVDEYSDTYEFTYADHNIYDGELQQDVDMSKFIRSLVDFNTLYVGNTKNWNVGMLGTIKRAYLRYEEGSVVKHLVKFSVNNPSLGVLVVQQDNPFKFLGSGSVVEDGTEVIFKPLQQPGANFVRWEGKGIPAGHETDSVLYITLTENVDIVAVFEADEPDDGYFIDIDFTAATPKDRKGHVQVEKLSDNRAVLTDFDWSFPYTSQWVAEIVFQNATIRSDGNQGYMLDAYDKNDTEVQVFWVQNNRYGISANRYDGYCNGQSNNYPTELTGVDVWFKAYYQDEGDNITTYDFKFDTFSQTNRNQLWCTAGPGAGGNEYVYNLSNTMQKWRTVYLGHKKGSDVNDQLGELVSFKIYDAEKI